MALTDRDQCITRVAIEKSFSASSLHARQNNLCSTRNTEWKATDFNRGTVQLKNSKGQTFR